MAAAGEEYPLGIGTRSRGESEAAFPSARRLLKNVLADGPRELIQLEVPGTGSIAVSQGSLHGGADRAGRDPAYPCALCHSSRAGGVDHSPFDRDYL